MRYLSELRTSSKPALRGSVALVAMLCATAFSLSDAQAQQVAQPNEGRQYFTVGLSLDPGFMLDSTADTAFTSAGMAQVGLSHTINRYFFMSAEAEAGVQWMRAHTAGKDGAAPSASDFAWQVGIYGHLLPFGQESGWVANAGIHLFTAHLEDAPLQVLGGELRLGRYIWTTDERFLLVQVGYALPILQGLARPAQYDENDPWADENWSFHRLSLGFQYGF